MADEDFEGDETMEEDAPPLPAGGGGGGPMKMIIIAVAVLAIGGGAAFFLMSGGDEEEMAEGEGEEQVEEQIDVGKVEKSDFGFPVSMEDQTINVMDGKRRRYLVYNATFEAEDEATAAELESRLRQLSDLLLREIPKFKFEQLMDVTFRDTLEVGLRAQVNARLMGEGKVKRIYFDQWIVQ